MALSYFTIRKSIFGRILGVSSTGGIVTSANSTGKLSSSDVTMSAQMWGPGMFQSIGAGATLTKITNCGVTYFTSDTTAAAAYNIAAPVKGVWKQIVTTTSSTLITINTTAPAIIFQSPSTLGLTLGATVGSTVINLGTAGGTGTCCSFRMVGLSTTQWFVTEKTLLVISS